MPPVTLTPLAGGNGIALTSARPGPDLAAAGWSEVEYAAAGSAPLGHVGQSLAAPDPPSTHAGGVADAGKTPSLPAHRGLNEVAFAVARTGRVGHPPRIARHTPDRTAFTTRVLLRRPESAPASGVLVVEWLNVSSGADAAPDWTYLADELVRQGHAWAGVSAQYNGVESGSAVVAVEGAGLQGLKAVDPVRYGGLHHPGDRHAHAIFTEVARAVAAEVGAGTVLAIGESQSAYLLTTHVNEVHLDDRFFAGYLIHSRGDVAAPAGQDGCGIDLLAARATGVPTPIRDDLDVPVLVLQTEGDLLGRMNYLPARQADGPLLRVWEVAGAAHADLFQIGEFEAFLGCPDPVNRGQQVYVARAALRHLVAWARGGPAAPAAPPLEVRDGAFVRDEVGNVRGGVRTPVVDAPVEVLAGDAPGGSVICGLFGRTLALAPHVLHDRWGSQEDYAAAYTAATDAAVAAGFVLPEDRAAVLGEMRTLS